MSEKFMQGEFPQKVQEAIKNLGYPPKEADILSIKQAIREAAKSGAPAMEVVVEPSKEEKMAARIKELTDTYSRRELEEQARALGIEPSKDLYKDKNSLAKAVAEKEAEPT